VTDMEIKLGQTMPYSGPASSIGTEGRVDQAYFAKINEEGGINGRKIKLLSLDDGFSPPKTVEQTRKLVEAEEVLALYHTEGTAPNSAIYKYLNARRVPHLLILSGADKFRDREAVPWTMPWLPALSGEGRTYAAHVLANTPDARIGVLYQSDDFGKDLLKGLRQGLGTRAETMIVGEQSFEVTDPTVDSQIVSLKGSGADTLMIFALPRTAAQALKKVGSMEWRPNRFVASSSANIEQVMKPVGLEVATGVMSVKWLKDPSDSSWKDDPAVNAYLAFMTKYYPGGDVRDVRNANAYASAQVMVQILKQCSNDLTRANLMRQSLNLRDLEVPMLLPGIKVNTSTIRHTALNQFQLVRLEGQRWVPVGGIVGD
jgi:branched-chain amino acid transport system substrate-binding protein